MARSMVRPVRGTSGMTWFVAFADDSQGSVTALEPEVLDVGRARFGDAQTVEAEQHGERGVGAVVVLGGE